MPPAIESGLGISAPKAGMGASQVYGNMAGRSVIRASVDGAVRGGTVESAARRAVGSFALGAAQYNVGEVGEKYGLEEGGAIKAAMHGFVGGVYAGSSGADPIIGAAAGMAGEIGASIDASLRAERGSPENEMNGSPQSLVLLREDAVSDVSAKLGFGASVLAFAAGGDARDIEAAGSVASSAMENNNLLHPSFDGEVEESKQRRLIESAEVVADGVEDLEAFLNSIADRLDEDKMPLGSEVLNWVISLDHKNT